MGSIFTSTTESLNNLLEGLFYKVHPGNIRFSDQAADLAKL